MSKRVESIRKIFIRRIVISTVVQVLVLTMLFFLVNHYRDTERVKRVFHQLTIEDSFSQQQLVRYQVLNNDYAFNLALHDMANDRALDSVSFSRHLDHFDFSHCRFFDNGQYGLCHDEGGQYYGLTLLSFNGERLGYVISGKKYHFVTTPFYYGLGVIFAIVVFAFLFNFVALFLTMRSKIEGSTRKLLDFIDKEKDDVSNVSILEYRLVAKQFLRKKKEISMLEKERSYNAAFSHLASQMAHDIKSPLSAINAVVDRGIGYSDAEVKVVKSALRRLSDIVSNLRQGNAKKITVKHDLGAKLGVGAEPVFFLVDALIAEKRFEYHKFHVDIDFIHDNKDAFYFSYVDSVEFNRLLSNIINNAVEACSDNKKISVEIRQDSEYVDIIIRDNGCGIPKSILTKVTEEGFSFGKKDGEGLGLFHAKDCLCRWGGDLLLDSAEGQGTAVTLRLRAAKKPAWMLDVIYLRDRYKLAILDDDPAMHDLWKMRLSNFSQVEVISAYNSDEFLGLINYNHDIDLFLIDYELSQDILTGLDIIEKAGIQLNSVLVTSSFDLEVVRQRCRKLSVPILPKPYIKDISISIIKNTMVLIDDDELTRESWSLMAEEKNITLHAFANIQEFESACLNLPSDVAIYVDSNLGGEVSGEVYARTLYQQGFLNIFIATGSDPEKFIRFPWVKGVIGKEPPF